MRLPKIEDESDSMQMTPLIDVVFLLLIFFLVATRFDQEEREIPTKLAEVAKAQPMAIANEVVVNVTDKGEYIVMGETLDEAMLAEFLHKWASNNRPLQIRADERVPFRFPARVMGLCERESIDHYCTVIEQFR